MKNSKLQLTDLNLTGLILSFALLFVLVACEKEPNNISENSSDLKVINENTGPFEFEAPVYDISATPDGSIMVGVNSGESRSIQLIKNGEIKTIQPVEVATDIQGIVATGTGNAFFTTGGSDLAKNGELYRVSNGNVRMVADLAKFERDNDPDAFEGLQWKNQLCEEEISEGDVIYNAGPQNNPFKVSALSGGTALVADAAGNTLLSATTSGQVDYKAIFTPPLDENGDWMVLFNREDNQGEQIPCYVQPVPTSVAVGPDGYIYVGELVGATPIGPSIGLSRVWKLPADATNLVCSEINGSADCNVLIEGLTSIIDLEIGPDGLLYVVEYDEGSWFASFIPDLISGGTISAYDLEGNLVKSVSGLEFPSAITFDKKGNLWVLEKNVMSPTVRMLEETAFEEAP